MVPAAPARDCFSDEIYKKERKEIYGPQWAYLAHEAELEEIGPDITLEIANYPIYLLRSDDGGIRAFHNICRHRPTLTQLSP